ncbi:MAG: 4-alpha-glucanotransferase [Ignavibacteria bacterium]|nr:4-alpha-glucanotransferase [Ignavibacteria bacterium]
MLKKDKEINYDWLLKTRTGEKWNKLGIQRRAGVCVPLFSVYSDKSIGTGEIPDIRLLIDWCRLAGLSVLQLLPLNELGYDFSPYNSISTFALGRCIFLCQNCLMLSLSNSTRQSQIYPQSILRGAIDSIRRLRMPR